MHRIIKRSYALILALAVLAGIVSGCSAIVSDPPVARIGNLEIKYSTYYNTYYQYYSIYSSYGLIDPSSTEDINRLKSDVFDMLIDQKLPVYMAKQNKLTLTEEDEAQVQKELEDLIESHLDQYKSDIDPALTDETQIRNAKMELLVKTLEDRGTNFDDYFYKTMYNELVDTKLGEKMRDIVVKDAQVSDEEAKERYDSSLASQRTDYKENPKTYYADYTNFIDGTGLKPFIAPEGYYYVKHIYIKDPAEDDTEKDVDKIVSEIQAQLDALGEEATVDERIAKFEELIGEYNEDTGLEQEPYKTEGYLMHPSLTDTYFASFFEEALKLENRGDISGPVKSDDGTHIIIRLGDVDSSKTLSFDEVKDDIIDTIRAEKEEELYLAALAEWREKVKIVKYTSRVAGITF